MKMLSKVVWAEGMYLGPQHFQAQNRHFEDTLGFMASALWANAFGWISFEVDHDALRNGLVLLTHARGVFEDGLVVDIPGADPGPEPRNIGAAFSPVADHLDVFVAIRRYMPDRQNTAAEGASPKETRDEEQERVLPDENTGRDEKPVRFGRKRLRLAVASELTDDLVALPLLRVMRDGAGHFKADPTFVQPCLTVTASSYLMGMLQRLVEILEAKSSVFARQQPTAEGGFQAGLSSRHVAQYWYLNAINSNLAPMRHFLLSKHVHPEELFQAMSVLGGALCTFGLDTHPRSLPVYQHRDPGPSFAALDEHIRRHLEIIVPTKAISIPLSPAGDFFYEGDIADERCLGPSRWFFRIAAQIGEADLIARTPALVKICSGKFVPELVKRALPGLAVNHVQVPPPEIETRIDSQYFIINRTGPCWEHMVQTRRVGVYAPGEFPGASMEIIVVRDN